MKGYWHKPEETAKVFTSEAGSAPATWVHERARPVQDHDRKKDMIIVSGFKVFPNEVEDVVMMTRR